jgi:hypothetical protein
MFFGAIYIKARDYHQDQAVSRVFLWMWAVVVLTMMCVPIIVYACNEESKVVRKETRNGFLSPAAYLVARTGIEIPMVVLLSMFALGSSTQARSSWSSRRPVAARERRVVEVEVDERLQRVLKRHHVD